MDIKTDAVGGGGTRFKTPVAHPEWLQDAIESADKTFELAIAKRLPESIAGWMLTVACMRILRAVYGDDLATAVAIRRSVLERLLPLEEEESTALSDQHGAEAEGSDKPKG